MGRGRPRKFNEQEVLDRAVTVFRERGYRGASMQALSAAMGIGEQSIYNAFGTKEQLYAAALARYVDHDASAALRALEAPDAGLETIRAWFLGLADQLAEAPDASPCMVLEQHVRPATDCSAARERSTQHTRRIERAFLRALERAGADGAAALEDPRTMARYLLVSMHGLAVVGRTGVSKRALRKVVRQILAPLDGS